MVEIPDLLDAAALQLLYDDPWCRTLVRLAGGRPLHLVGGAIRDGLLGERPLDLDLVIDGDGEAVSRAFAREIGGRWVRLGGERFAAFRVVLAPEEAAEEAGVEPRVMDLWDRAGQSLEADLARRDLTINALALDLASGELIDLFGGCRDLAEGVLRATTPEAFTGDALRVLRLARFAAELAEFVIDRPTLALATAAADGLKGIAVERLRYELGRIFATPTAAAGVDVLWQTGVYPRLLWEVDVEAESLAEGLIDVLIQLEILLANLQAAAPALDGTLVGAINWALSFAVLPAPPEPVARLRAFQRRGLLSRPEADIVARFLPIPTWPTSSRERRRFLHEFGPWWLEAVLVRAALDGASFASVAPLCEQLDRLLEREGDALFDPPQLLAAAEVQALLGITPGPTLGQALRALREAQVEGRVGHRLEAERYLRVWDQKRLAAAGQAGGGDAGATSSAAD